LPILFETLNYQLNFFISLIESTQHVQISYYRSWKSIPTS